MRATKFTAHAQYHMTCAYEVPQNYALQFLTPDCLFTVKLLWGYAGD